MKNTFSNIIVFILFAINANCQIIDSTRIKRLTKFANDYYDIAYLGNVINFTSKQILIEYQDSLVSFKIDTSTKIIIDDEQRKSWKDLTSVKHVKIVTSDNIVAKGIIGSQSDAEEVISFINAAQKGDSLTIKNFLDKGIDINIKDKKGYTALAKAAATGQLEIVNILLSSPTKPTANKIDVNIKTKSGITPIGFASFFGKTEIVKLLIENGANVNTTDPSGTTPLLSATSRGHANVVEQLIKAGANVNAKDTSKTSSIYIAAQNGETEIVKILIQNGVNVNGLLRGGVTPLFIAAQNGRPEVVELLIKNGANVNFAASKGTTPLIMAAWNGNIKIVKLLINAGADINAKDSKNSVLGYAKAKDDKEIIKLLVNAGAK